MTQSNFKRTIDLVYSEDLLSERESPWGTTQREQKEGLEFNFKEYKEIDNYCKSKKIDWFASAWDLESQNFLKQFNCKFNKVASAMITYNDLLKEIASEGKHFYFYGYVDDRRHRQCCRNISRIQMSF